jgi:hypothetical protein
MRAARRLAFVGIAIRLMPWFDTVIDDWILNERDFGPTT